MNSSAPFQFSPSPRAKDEAPIAASFSRTLRAFAEEHEIAVPPPAARPQAAVQRPQPAGARPRAAAPATAAAAEQRHLKIFGAPLGQSGSAARQPAESKKILAEMIQPKPAKPADAAAVRASPSPARSVSHARWLARAWSWLQKQPAFSGKKKLRVSETVSLGDKRFVAVVHIEGQKFLIGGGASGVSLLAELETDAELSGQAELEAEAASEALQPIAFAGGRTR